MAQLGVSGVALWTQKGKAYGSIIDGDNKTFPSYTLYQWGAKHLTGKMAESISGDRKLLEIVGATRSDGRKSVLLMNKSDHTLQIPAAKVLLPGAKSILRIDAEGVQNNLAFAGDRLELPGYSLTLLVG
jgi:hypothetical protein